MISEYIGNGWELTLLWDGGVAPVACQLNSLVLSGQHAQALASSRSCRVTGGLAAAYRVSGIELTWTEARQLLSGVDPLTVLLHLRDFLWARPLTLGELMAA